jgi:hypothetical protein
MNHEEYIGAKQIGEGTSTKVVRAYRFHGPNKTFVYFTITGSFPYDGRNYLSLTDVEIQIANGVGMIPRYQWNSNVSRYNRSHKEYLNANQHLAKIWLESDINVWIGEISSQPT